MSLIVLDMELIEKNIFKELGLFIDGFVKRFSFVRQILLNLINRQHGTQDIYMELRGVVESWKKRRFLTFFTT